MISAGFTAWIIIIAIFLISFTAQPHITALKRRILQRSARKKEAIELLLTNRTARSQWARTDLENARKDAIPDLRDECESTHETSHLSYALQDLPPEVRISIYECLDYGSGIMLGKTSRFFYNDSPRQAVPREQRASFVFHAESFPKNENLLACFHCLRLLPKSEFLDAQQKDGYARFGDKEFDRFCFQCGVRRRIIEWSTLKELSQRSRLTMAALRDKQYLNFFRRPSAN